MFDNPTFLKLKQKSTSLEVLFCFGLPGRARTGGLESRSLALYPTGLRVVVAIGYVVVVLGLLPPYAALVATRCTTSTTSGNCLA